MTQNRRILLNIAATYGRSLYALIIGLFCGRWTLMVLGETDYGLMGLIGGLTMFISYFNSILATAIGRFFAFSVGRAEEDRKIGMEMCHQWFTTAIMLHTVVPIILITIGYPLGVWAINEKLVIPTDRVSDCIWVWRFVCTTCFLGMVSVPFNAMYTAKQYIAELTIYSFITTTLNAAFLYYMVTHDGVWLVPYAFFLCLLGVLPQVIIAVRACSIFEECRFRWKYVNCMGHIKQLGGFSIWTAWGVFGGLCRNQGLAILTNLFFGPRVNSGLNIGGTVSAHCNTLSGSMTGAFSPVIVNAWGAARYQEARNFAYRTCKFGTLFFLVFALPLLLEVDEVLLLWLKNPPPFATGFCVLVILMNLIERLSTGHQIMVNAKGKVALYQCFSGTSLVFAIPICWLLLKVDVGPYSVGWAMVISMMLCTGSRIYFASSLVGMSARYWLKEVFLPLVLVSIVSLAVGSLVKLVLQPSFWRIIITTVAVESFFISSVWLFVFAKNERQYLIQRATAFRMKFK